MAHPRKLIRQAVVALLVSVGTAAGARVLGTRVDPHKKSQLPAISVYTLNDPVDEDASSTTEDAHELELEVAAWVAHTDALPVDDAMDDIAEQIEAAMNGDPYLGNQASKVRLVGSTMEVIEDDGRSSPMVGIIVLTYTVHYRTDLTAPAPTDLFLSVKANQEIVGGVSDTVPASDQFTVQEAPP